jgi:cytochrome b subunit of formate dehydrogenase
MTESALTPEAVVETESSAQVAPPVARAASYRRFSVSQRIEHVVSMVSFTVLAVTGLPQKFPAAPLSEGTIALFRGIEGTRVIHRWAAVILVAASIYHVVAVLYRRIVKGKALSLVPGWKDATDVWDTIRYDLGLTRVRPQYPRYSFGEKAEYWAFVWGTLVMAVTGFILWNPISTARLLPGQVIPAAKAAHGGEALLAVLAIILWHFYHVHVKTLNKSMFTGRLTAHQMAEEHGAELAALEQGLTQAELDEWTRHRRRLIFVPTALITLAALFFGLYRFATFEQTALAAAPDMSVAPVLVRATATMTPTRIPSPTPTPSPTPQPTATTDPAVAATVTAAAATGAVGPAVPAATRAASGPRTTGLGRDVTHTVVGREVCSSCHTTGSPPPLGLPPSHAGRADTTCLACHAPRR